MTYPRADGVRYAVRSAIRRARSWVAANTIRAYYKLDRPFLRALARGAFSLERRTALLNRFWKNSPYAAPDVGSAFAGQSTSLMERGRRVATYRLAVDCDAIAGASVSCLTAREPHELQPTPYWGNGPALASRWVTPLPALVCQARDAEIEGDCLGLFSGENFISMLLAAPSPHCFEPYSKNDPIMWGRLVSFALGPKPDLRTYDHVVFVDSHASYGRNYFHAQVDLVSSLVAACDWLAAQRASKTVLLLPEGLPDTTRDLIALYAARYELTIEAFDSRTRVFARTITFAPYSNRMVDLVGLDAIGPFHTVREDVRRLRDVLHSEIRPPALAPVPIAERRPVYLTRAAYLSEGGRGTLNAADVAAYVEGLGGVTVAPQNLSLEEQMRVMASASLIICDAGAAVANALFAPPGTPVLIMTQHWTRPNLFMSYLQALEMRPGFVYGEAQKVADADAAHFSFRLPLDHLERAVKFMSAPVGAGTCDGWH